MDDYYFREEIHVNDNDSGIAVCTLWAPIHKLKEYYDDPRIHMIGQLKTTEGCNYLLSNVAKAGIRHLVVIKGKFNLTSSYEMLLKHKNLKLIPHLTIHTINNIKELPKELQRLCSGISITCRAEPIDIPIPDWEFDYLDCKGTYKQFEFRNDTFEMLHKKLLYSALIFGAKVDSQWGPTKELVDVTFSANIKGDLKRNFPDYEEWWDKYADDLLKHENNSDADYSYGTLLREALNQTEYELNKTPRSRQYYLDLYGTWYTYHACQINSQSHPPCLCTIQVLDRQSEITVICNWRSNDIFRALPLNYYALYKYFQTRYKCKLNLIFHIGSAHVYKTEWPKLVNELPIRNKKITDGTLIQQDYRCNLVFEKDKKVKVLDYDGNTINVLNLDNLNNLCELAQLYVTNFEHYDYIKKEYIKNV